MSTAMIDPLDDKALRRAWLKQKFASFEYHEEMVKLHRKWLDVLRQALTRAEGDDSALSKDSGFKSVREWAVHFRKRFVPLIEANDDLGKYDKGEWPRYRATSTFRSIPDYSRYLISEGDALGWMTEAEHVELGKYWRPMAQMAENIRYTIDGNWDAHPKEPYWILDAQCTGSVVWPATWREDLLGQLATSLSALAGQRFKAGEPVPQSGVWQALDSETRQERVNVGDTLPDLNSAYGITVWQRVDD